MKHLILICLLLWTFMAMSQEVKVNNKPFTCSTEEQCIKNSVKTTKFIVDKSGNKIYLYQGAKGGLFYITKNKEGQFLKKYVKI